MTTAKSKTNGMKKGVGAMSTGKIMTDTNPALSTIRNRDRAVRHKRSSDEMMGDIH